VYLFFELSNILIALLMSTALHRWGHYHWLFFLFLFLLNALLFTPLTLIFLFIHHSFFQFRQFISGLLMLLKEVVDLVVKKVLDLLIEGWYSFEHVFFKGSYFLRLPVFSLFYNLKRFV
jgi:hypothetical protein